jgi:hypothetical protein
MAAAVSEAVCCGSRTVSRKTQSDSDSALVNGLSQAVLHGFLACWVLTHWAATDPAYASTAAVATASSATAVLAQGLRAVLHDVWSIESTPEQSSVVVPDPMYGDAAARQSMVRTIPCSAAQDVACRVSPLTLFSCCRRGA